MKKVCFWLVVIALLGVRRQCASQALGTRQADIHAPSDDRNWQVEVVGTGGFPPGYTIHSVLTYHENVDYFSAGVVIGKTITGRHGNNLWRGRGELLGEFEPLWLAHEPRQTDPVQTSAGETFQATFPGYTDFGLQAVPICFRWNFNQNNKQRIVPWAQAGVALLWTSNKFPQGTGESGGNTSNINFVPQLAVGFQLFVMHRQSMDFGIELSHISSAGLGEFDPGVGPVLQFRVGHSWWR